METSSQDDTPGPEDPPQRASVGFRVNPKTEAGTISEIMNTERFDDEAEGKRIWSK